MSEPEEHQANDEDPIELTEPQIQEEIANSDEWMQKGLTDSDPPEDETSLREERTER